MNACIFLAAIALVESGADDSAIGPRGERGRYQFTATTWAQHSELPHARAHSFGQAHAVAVKHVAWLRGRLGEDVYTLARGWNEGVTGVRRRPYRVSEYATRVARLYEYLEGLCVSSPVNGRTNVLGLRSCPERPGPARVVYSSLGTGFEAQ